MDGVWLREKTSEWDGTRSAIRFLSCPLSGWAYWHRLRQLLRPAIRLVPQLWRAEGDHHRRHCRSASTTDCGIAHPETFVAPLSNWWPNLRHKSPYYNRANKDGSVNFSFHFCWGKKTNTCLLFDSKLETMIRLTRSAGTDRIRHVSGLNTLDEYVQISVALWMAPRRDEPST